MVSFKKARTLRLARTTLLATFVLIALPRLHANEDKPSAKDSFQSTVQPFFKRHCYECHGPDKQRGELRLDVLEAEFATDKGAKIWSEVEKRLQAGEMPPKSKPRPPKEQLEAVTHWLSGELAAASADRQRREGRVVLRRLNRNEYQNTIRDLLAVDVELKDLLPEDTSSHGFDNVGEALNVSSVLMERYLEAADVALDAAIVTESRPRIVKKRYSYKNERVVENKRIFRELDDAVVFFGSRYSPTPLRQFRASTTGKYRFRISARAFQSDKPVTMSVYGGDVLGRDGRTHLIDYFDAQPKSTVVEFTDRMERLNSIRIVPYNTGHDIYQIGAQKYKDPGLAVEWVEVEGPLIDQWPPERHQRLLGSLDLKKATAKDAEAILEDFVPRAFRRPVTETEIAPYLSLVRDRLDKGYDFESALRVGLKAVLCSPSFLYFREKPGGLDDYAIASRLSYFFWSSMPDKQLLDLAAKGSLKEAKVLREQVERLLKDEKAAEFTKNFVGQWLRLREIDFTTPDPKLYPEHDELLQVSMVKETELFFDEILKNDLSLHNFIDSEFSLLNERLAEHYGIEGVKGQAFRKVKLPAESHRGGVLTQASVLKVTANGTNTSPVMRGTWVLENVMGKPVPPPPANVPAVEPDIRGATTIRQQLAKHRDVASCASCHEKIDPPGFALESFDVIGGWRENYRSLGQGERVGTEVRNRRVQYRKGPAVDASGELPSGERFGNVDDLKKLLLEDKDQIARCLTEKLLVYGSGAPITPNDRKTVEAIVARARADNYGFRSLIHSIIQSEIFLKK